MAQERRGVNPPVLDVLAIHRWANAAPLLGGSVFPKGVTLTLFLSVPTGHKYLPISLSSLHSYGMRQTVTGALFLGCGYAAMGYNGPIVITHLFSDSMKTTFSAVLLVILSIASSFVNGAEPLRFFVGTYTDRDSKGIYTGTFDTERGALEKPTLVAECSNPAFLTLHPSKPYLYAVTETPKGMLLAFQYNKQSGQLTPLDEKETRGQISCHLVFCPAPNGAGGAIPVANYSSGNVVSFPILENGKMGEAASDILHTGSGPNAARQEAPHPHGVYFDGTTIAVPDLGIDQVVYYKIDTTTAVLSPSADHANLRLAPGAGPRHLAASKDRRFTFVVNEFDSTVSVFDRRNTKSPELIQTISTLAEGKDAAALHNTTAEIELHPNGKSLYASNRGDDSIAVFAVNEGKLTFLQNVPTGGKTPRFFCIDPTQRFLLACNQDSGNICVFRIDPETGKLTPTGQSVDTPRPICIVFVP